jgi:pilus assembly protein FimV
VRIIANELEVASFACASGAAAAPASAEEAAASAASPASAASAASGVSAAGAPSLRTVSAAGAPSLRTVSAAGAPSLRTTGRLELRVCGPSDKARALEGELHALAAGAGASAAPGFASAAASGAVVASGAAPPSPVAHPLPHGPRGLVVYLGDSPTDIGALLAADVGIVLRRGGGRLRVARSFARGEGAAAGAGAGAGAGEGADGASPPAAPPAPSPSSLHKLAAALGVAVLPLAALTASGACVDALARRAAAPLSERLAAEDDEEAAEGGEAAWGEGAAGPPASPSADELLGFSPRIRALRVRIDGAPRPVLWEAEGWDEIAAALFAPAPPPGGPLAWDTAAAASPSAIPAGPPAEEFVYSDTRG